MGRIPTVAIVLLGPLSVSAADQYQNAPVTTPSRMEVRALRLSPGADLKQELSRFARENRLRAGVVLTCVGSLTRAVVRLADQPEGTVFEGKHEIVSLVGTLSPDGDHLHVAVSDSSGRTLGGHLMDGSLVYTTAEIAVGELTDLSFARETDAITTYKELAIRKR